MKIIVRIISKLQRTYSSLIYNTVTGVSMGEKVFLKGHPDIKVRIKGGKIKIGSNVLLNSKNDNYHINLHSPIKIYTSSNHATIKIGENSRIQEFTERVFMHMNP